MSTRCGVVCISMLAGATVHSMSQQATFSAKLEAVRVDVLVSDRSDVVRDLKPGDFEIRDNGIPQAVDLVSFQQIPLNVILALDVSASVSGERLDDLQKAARALLGRLTKQDKAALLTFSHAVSLRERLSSDVSRVAESLSDVQPAGETALVDGAHAAMMLEAADSGRNLLIVFSDGLDTASWLDPGRVLESARRSDLVVYGAESGGAEDSEVLE